MMGIITKFHPDGRRQGMFVIDGIPDGLICCLLVYLTGTRAVENDYEKIPKRLKKMGKNNLRLFSHHVISVHCQRLRFGLDVIPKHFKPRSY